MSIWMIRNRSLRSKGKKYWIFDMNKIRILYCNVCLCDTFFCFISVIGRPPPEDCYRLDKLKSPAENAYDIYLGLSSRMTNENKRLSLLNALVKLLVSSKESNIGFTTEEFLYW